MKWKSSKHPPKKAGQYLAAQINPYGNGYIVAVVWYTPSDGGWRVFGGREVTHWMKLPAPPKGS